MTNIFAQIPIDLEIGMIKSLISIRNRLDNDGAITQYDASKLVNLGVIGLPDLASYTEKPSSVNLEETLVVIREAISSKTESLMQRHPENQTVVAFTNDVLGISTSQEGFWGAIGGFFVGGNAGLIPGLGTFLSVATKNRVKQLEAERERLEKVLLSAVKTGAIKARDEGKINNNEFKILDRMNTEELVYSVVLGTMFTPIYNAITFSKIEDLNEEIKTINKQLDEIAAEARREAMKSGQY